MWPVKVGVDNSDQERWVKYCEERNYINYLSPGEKLFLLSLYQTAMRWLSHRTVLPPAHPVSLTL